MYGEGFDEGGTLNHHPEGKSYKDVVRERERKSRGGSGRGCFPYNALVATPYGPVRIGYLTVGQIVLSYNDGQLVPRQITKKVTCPPMEVTKVDFDEGQPLLTTWNHLFLTNHGWKRTDKITVGTQFIQARAVLVRLKRLRW